MRYEGGAPRLGADTDRCSAASAPRPARDRSPPRCTTRAARFSLVRRTLPVLRGVIRAVAVTVARRPTRMRAVLERRVAGSPSANARGPLYAGGPRRGPRPDHVHYLDFDRAVHWRRISHACSIIRPRARCEVLLLGREKAHRSHHRPLYATEAVVNRLLADRLGWSGRVDFLVPSFVLHREAARTLLRRSRARDESMYGEWAAIMATLAPSLSYVECGALDWETPDRHRRAVRRMGLVRWRTRQETAAEWTSRIAMAETIVSGFERAMRRAGAPAAMARLRPSGSTKLHAPPHAAVKERQSDTATTPTRDRSCKLPPQLHRAVTPRRTCQIVWPLGRSNAQNLSWMLRCLVAQPAMAADLAWRRRSWSSSTVGGPGKAKVARGVRPAVAKGSGNDRPLSASSCRSSIRARARLRPASSRFLRAGVTHGRWSPTGYGREVRQQNAPAGRPASRWPPSNRAPAKVVGKTPRDAAIDLTGSGMVPTYASQS